MCDELIEGSSVAYTREKHLAAEYRVAQIADVDGAIANLAKWCLSVVRKRSSRVANDFSTVAPLSYLSPSAQLFPDVADGQVKSALREGLVALFRRDDHELRDVAAVVLGKAVTAALVSGVETRSPPVDMLIALLWRGLATVDDLTWLELNSSLDPVLRKDDAMQRAFLEYLGLCVDGINRSPSKHVPKDEREVFERRVQDWRERPSMTDLWRGTASFVPADFNELVFAPTILKCCPTKTLQHLDRLRFPEPLEYLLESDEIRNDRGWIAELLRCAPASVDTKSVWNGSLLALLVLRIADDHCRRLWEAVGRRGGDLDTASRVLSSWIDELASLVMERKDGQFLAAHWLLMKVADERLERAHSGRQDVIAQADMIRWIGNGLSQAGMDGTKIADFVNFPTTTPDQERCEQRQDMDDRDRLPQCLAAVSMMAMLDCMDDDDDGKVQDGEKVLECLDVLLAVRDPGFEVEVSLDVGVTGLPASCVGYVLAKGDDPAQRWRRSWYLLSGQRRVVQHWRHTKDADAMAPSLFLQSAGLAALDWLCSEPRRQDEAEGLWCTLFDAARECLLTMSVVHLTERIHRDVGLLFARHSTIFANSNCNYSELLASDLNLLGGDDVLVARCCELVGRNLDKPSLLHRALKCNSGWGYALLDQFAQWQALEREAKREPKLLEAVQTMRERLGMTLDAQ